MAQQTSYALDLAAAYAGTLADSRDHQSDYRRNDFGAEMPYGIGVVKSSNADNLGMTKPSALGNVFAGILVHSMKNEQTATGLASLGAGDVVSVGRCNVICENGWAMGDAVAVRYTAGSGFLPGSIRGGAVVVGETSIITDARFLNSGSAGGVAVVEVNLSGPSLLA